MLKIFFKSRDFLSGLYLYLFFSFKVYSFLNLGLLSEMFSISGLEGYNVIYWTFQGLVESNRLDFICFDKPVVFFLSLSFFSELLILDNLVGDLWESSFKSA